MRVPILRLCVLIRLHFVTWVVNCLYNAAEGEGRYLIEGIGDTLRRQLFCLFVASLSFSRAPISLSELWHTHAHTPRCVLDVRVQMSLGYWIRSKRYTYNLTCMLVIHSSGKYALWWKLYERGIYALEQKTYVSARFTTIGIFRFSVFPNIATSGTLFSPQPLYTLTFFAHPYSNGLTNLEFITHNQLLEQYNFESFLSHVCLSFSLELLLMMNLFCYRQIYQSSKSKTPVCEDGTVILNG